MRRSLITLLIAITLLSQWGWVEHGYHSHDSGDVCEVCVNASGHVALMPTAPQLPHQHGSELPVAAFYHSFNPATPRYYTSRAPPRFL